MAKPIALRSNEAKNFDFAKGELKLNEINNPTLRDFTAKLVKMVVPY